MDKLSFRIESRPDNINRTVALPYIHDVSLIELVASIEKKYDEGLAGSYDGIRPDLLLRELREGSIHNTTKSKILECECGVDGCWSLLMKITENEIYVEWSDFEQTHTDWSYNQLGHFRFHILEYEQALKELSCN